MKIGTFRCRLFGHNFAQKHTKFAGTFMNLVWTEPVKFCVRCGVPLSYLKVEVAPNKSEE